jgi:hypothetical protein
MIDESDVLFFTLTYGLLGSILLWLKSLGDRVSRLEGKIEMMIKYLNNGRK